jgi:hypothetical protein
MPFVIAIVAVIAVLGIGGYVLQSSNTASVPAEVLEVSTRPEDVVAPTVEAAGQTTPDATPIATPPAEATEQTTPDATPIATPSDQSTYTARGEYLTPARTEHIIDVTLTLENGIVTDADIIYDEGNGFSNPHQQRFDGAYKAQVIGKSLSQINLSRVGGASVTSRSFNVVVTAIKAQISA